MRFKLIIILGIMGSLASGCSGTFPESDGSAVSALLAGLGISSGSPGIAITQTNSNTSVSEAGLSDTYTIALNSQPADPVTVTITFDGTQVSVNGSTAAVTLTFNGSCPGASCWNTEQTITVGGVNNTTIEATNTTQTITHTLASGDSNYAGLTAALDVSLLDNSLTWTQTSNLSIQDEKIEQIAMDANYIYAVGSDGQPGKNQWRIEKRDINSGALVAGFGTGGLIRFDPNALQNDGAQSVAVDANYIYIAGYQRGITDEWRIEKRDINTGALVAAFGTGGVLIVEPAPAGADRIFSMVISATNIYLAGYDSTNTNRQWRIEKRDITTGALTAAFGTGGVVASNPSINNDEPRDMILDGANLYIVGFDRSVANKDQWRIEKRDSTTGALVAAFGTGGVQLVNPSLAENDHITSVTTDAAFVYTVGFDRALSTSNSRLRVEKRNKTTAALDAGFGTGGVILVDISPADDFGQAIAVDATRVYVGATDRANGNNRWNVFAFNITTGALDTTFDGDGILQVQNGLGAHAFEHGLLIDNTYLYLAGADGFSGDMQWRLEKRVKSTGAFSF